MDVVVETRRLCKSYGRRPAIVDIDLDIFAGEVFGYLGPNGAGKTTTIRLLLGLLRPTSGTASVFGLDSWRESPQVHRRTGYVAGEPAFYPKLSGAEHVAYLGGLRHRDFGPVADLLAQRLDLDLSRPVGQLSRGNRQKLALVLAFMGDPDLLVLDEPTGGLDPLVQQEFHHLLREHTGRGGTVMLSSHVLDEVQRVADRIGIIRAGRLVAVERLDELRGKSLHHVWVRFAEPVEEAEFLVVPEVRDLHANGAELTCNVPGPALDQLLKVVTQHTVTDLAVQEADLEETFLTYYGRVPSGAF